MRIFDSDSALRLLTLFFLSARFLYWIITERKADAEKQKSKPVSVWAITKRVVTQMLGVVIGVQLLGVEIVSFPKDTNIQLIGLGIVVLGVFVSVVARRELGANWTHAAEYQIKKGHELVTSGIYKYIRHPIYTGFILSVVGAELVASSYLVIPLFFILLVHAYVQAKKEEGILKKEFGQKYTAYMERSQMFVPYIW